MTLAACLFFITPAVQNLDVASQGLNTWHSFQYLALVICLNRCRQAHGMVGSATVARFAARGWGLYDVGIGLIAACGVLYLVRRGLLSLSDASPGDVMQQHYFCFSVSVHGVCSLTRKILLRAHANYQGGRARRCASSAAGSERSPAPCFSRWGFLAPLNLL